MPYSISETKKDFAKIPTDLNSMWIGTELVKFWRKLENIFFAVLKGFYCNKYK